MNSPEEKLISEKINSELVSSIGSSLTDVNASWPAIHYSVEEVSVLPIYERWRTHTSFHAIKDLIADNEGLWAISKGGVARITFKGSVATIDGYRSEHGIHGTDYQGVIVDKFGRPWCYGCHRGAAYFHDNQWNLFTRSEGLPSDCILSAAIGFDNTIWFGTDRGAGFISFDSQMGPYWCSHDLSQAKLPHNIIQSITLNSDGALMLGTPWGLYVKNKSESDWHRITKKDGLPSLDITCLTNKGQGEVWIGTSDGLAIYQDGIYQPVSEIGNRIIKIVKSPGSLEFWFITPIKVWRYSNGQFESVLWPLFGGGSQRITAITAHPKLGEFVGGDSGLVQRTPVHRTILKPDTLNQEPTTSLSVDSDGNLWAGSITGLKVYFKESWRPCTVSGSPETPIKRVSQIMTHEKGNVLVGSRGEEEKGGLFESKHFHILKRFAGKGVPKAVDAIYLADDKSIFVASGSAIMEWVGGQWQAYVDSPDPTAIIQALLVDTDGVYCGCSSGLFFSHDGNWAKIVSAPVNSLAKDSNNAVWTGTSSGLYVVNDGAAKQINLELVSQKINVLLCIDRNDLWMGTTAELARVDTSTTNLDLQTWNSDSSGLPRGGVYSLAYDSRRHCLWIGTGSGISQFFINDLF